MTGELSLLEIIWIIVGIISWTIYIIDIIFWIYEKKEIKSGAYSKEQIDALIKYRQIKYNHYYEIIRMILIFWPMIGVIIKSLIK